MIDKYFAHEVQTDVCQSHGDFDEQKAKIKRYLEMSYSDLEPLFTDSYDAEIRYFIKKIEDRHPNIIERAMAEEGLGIEEKEREREEIKEPIKPEPKPPVKDLYEQAGKRLTYEHRAQIDRYVGVKMNEEAVRRGVRLEDMSVKQKVDMIDSLGLGGTYAELSIIAGEGKLDTPREKELSGFIKGGKI